MKDMKTILIFYMIHFPCEKGRKELIFVDGERRIRILFFLGIEFCGVRNPH